MTNELTVKSTGSNLAAACLAKKERLEAALVAAIDAKDLRLADTVAREMAVQGLLPTPEAIAAIRRVVERRERRQANRAAKAA